MAPDAQRARIAWRCRRGLLELDLVLQRFLESEYPALNEPERTCFARLLEESDADLWEWIQGAKAPTEYSELVARLR